MSRDSIIDNISEISIISPRIRDLLNKALNAPNRNMIDYSSIKALSQEDRNDFFILLDNQFSIIPDDKQLHSIYHLLIIKDKALYLNKYVTILNRIDCKKLPAPLGVSFREILEACDDNEQKSITDLLSKNSQLMDTINPK